MKTTIFRRALEARTSRSARWVRVGAAASIAATGLVIAAPTQVIAGEEPSTSLLTIVVVVEGVGAQAVLDGVTVELFTNDGSVGPDILPTAAATCFPIGTDSRIDYAETATDCTIPNGSYLFGLDGVPDGYDVEVDCDSFFAEEALDPTEVPGAEITLFSDEGFCELFVLPPENLSVALLAPFATDYNGVLDGIVVEAFAEPGGANVVGPTLCRSETKNAAFLGLPGGVRLVQCEIPLGDYTLGLDAIPPDVEILTAECFDDSEPLERIDSTLHDSTFTLVDGDVVTCDVELIADPTVYLDANVLGGSATVADFELEVYSTSGDMLGTATDPSADACTADPGDDLEVTLSTCGTVRVPTGDYQLGAVLPDYGYVASSAACTDLDISPFVDTERFDSGVGEFSHGEPIPDFDPLVMESLCSVSFLYVTQIVSADVVIVNDDAGTVNGASVQIEVYDSSGNLVDSKPDPEPGTGNASAEFVLPIGDYTFGFSGADGYDATVEVVNVTVTPVDIIDAASADFSLSRTNTVTATVTLDDQFVAPTTTITTTTTVAPTTTVDPGGAILPETGSSGPTGSIGRVALLMLLAGGALLLARRRNPAPR